MKNMKKLLSLAVVLVMLVALAVPAMAADTYTITINGTHTGHTYEAYQIFSGTLEETTGVLSDIEWGSGVDGAALLAALKGNEPLFGGEGADNEFSACTTAEAVAGVIKSWSPDSAKLDRFAEIVGANLATVTGTSTEGKTEVDGVEVGNKVYTIDVPAGYYLVKDQDGTVEDEYDYYTKFIIRVVKDSEVVPKGNVPTLDKTVNTTIGGTYADHISASIGQTVYYKLEGTLPSNYADYEKYHYIFTDTMSAGLTYGKIEQIYIQHQSNTTTSLFDSTTDPAAVIPSYFEIDHEEVGNVLTIKVANLKESLPALLASDKIVIKYSAAVSGGKLTGWTTDADDATVLTTGADGKISVGGLDAGIYHLTEIAAPAGYNKLDTDVRVTITAGYTGTDLTSLDYVVDGMSGSGNPDTGIVEVNVRNNAGTTLPSTGGIGTTIFYTLGGTLVIGAVILLITKKRMSSEA